jgi:hypothetical protein
MLKTKKTSLHPKKGEPKNAPVTRARTNTSTNADTASTSTGAATTSGGVVHEVDRKTQSNSPSYTTADTTSTGTEALSSSSGLERETANTGTEAAIYLVAWSAKVRVKQVSITQILSVK